MSETRQVAEFVTGTSYDRLPAQTRDNAKILVMDQVAIWIGVSSKPWLQHAVNYVKAQGGHPEASIACGDKTSAENAAFTNGTFGHGFEMDDLYAAALAHPGPAVVPAAVAVAEREGSSGKDLIAAIVAGYEVFGRVGYALSPSQLYRGFHPTSAVGPLGAAASAGRLMGMDTDTMVNALAVAGSFCSGLTECYKTGGEVKRYHGGISASGGVRAAALAKLGLTGPPTILEGPLGVRAMSDTFTVETLTEGLGEQYVADWIWLKRHAANGFIHAPIDAIQNIRKRRPFESGDVKRIVAGSNQHAIQEVGSIRRPKDIFGFQFSMYYALAMQIVLGSNAADKYTLENMANPEFAALSDKITVETDPDVNALFPEKLSGKVTIEFTDGTTETEMVIDPRGAPENPMTPDERRAKWHGLARLTIGETAMDEVIAAVDKLETVANVRELGDLIRQGT